VFYPEESFDLGEKKFRKSVLDYYYLMDGWPEQELGKNQRMDWTTECKSDL